MSYSVSLQQRIQQLKRVQADVPKVLARVAKDATLRAIEAAQAATPPKAGTGRGPYIGTGTITGELKAHWATDSKTEPMGGALSGGSTYVTVLANNQPYASYVNDGHRMARHFVPGLYINPESGLLEYDASKKVGLVVGTKTSYVKGEFMTDKGKEAYEKAVLSELGKEIERLMR
nr:MAG TPA: putative tail-component [Caudoviricetes sp.]